jgi:two-component system phosphate regulon sensor histidine kinase PhoR
MKKRKKLVWRLFPSYLLITLLSLIAVSWYATSSLRKFYIEQTATDLKARAHLLEQQIGQYLEPLSPEAVDALCKEAGKMASTRITVILPSGVVIGDSREEPRHMDNHATRPEIAQALKGETGKSIRRSETLQQQMMYVAIALRKSEEAMAVVRTSLPVTSIFDELADIRIKISIGGLLIAIIAAAISLIISRQYSRPLVRLKQGADRFARGELDHRLMPPDSEELAALADAMNQMARQLDNRIKTIENQRHELETVLSSMVESLLAVDGKERIISLNRAAARWFGTDIQNVQGRSIQEVIRDLTLQKFVANALENRERMQRDITVFHNGERVLNVQSSPLLDTNRKRKGTLIIFNDVTQLRRLENLRRDFVANVSHEIKTPLTAIKGFVETLHQGSVDNPEETVRFLGIVRKHVDRLNSIIEDLLSLSRIEQENEARAIKFEIRKIREVFTTALQICRSKAEKKQIEINQSCPDKLKAKFDPSLLEQAVVNLLDNAIKYSDSGSMIFLEAVRSNGSIRIRITDQGMGIAKKHLPRLFERFYRVDKARSRKLGGTGLGLAIVKHIAQAHGGRIAVESKLGEGSTFTLELPAE